MLARTRRYWLGGRLTSSRSSFRRWSRGWHFGRLSYEVSDHDQRRVCRRTLFSRSRRSLFRRQLRYFHRSQRDRRVYHIVNFILTHVWRILTLLGHLQGERSYTKAHG